MILRSIITKYRIDVLLVLGLCFCIIYYVTFNLVTDIKGHTEHVMNINDGNASYPPNFLYYLFLNISGLFTNKILGTYMPSVVVLALAITAKYVITANIIKDFVKQINSKLSEIYIYAISFGLIFSFAIPEYYSIVISEFWYLGKFVPHVWHNSTTMFLEPFGLALFWVHFGMINNTKESSWKNVILLVLLILANAFIKPSFLFVYIPVVGFVILHKYGIKKPGKLLLEILPLIIGILGVCVVYILVYFFELGSFQGGDSKVILGAPFEILRSFIPLWYIPISIFTSYCAVIVFIYYNRNMLKEGVIRVPILMGIVGILITAFLIEDGPRKYHFNFSWQNISTTYLIFLGVTLLMIKKRLVSNVFTKKDRLVFYLMILHSISGVLYVFKIIIYKTYV